MRAYIQASTLPRCISNATGLCLFRAFVSPSEMKSNRFKSSVNYTFAIFHGANIFFTTRLTRNGIYNRKVAFHMDKQYCDLSAVVGRWRVKKKRVRGIRLD